jgi:hypothetical protein
MLNVSLLAAPPVAALAIYDSLVALGLGTIGAWTDCARRLDLAAAEAKHAAQARKMRARADDCRARARRMVVVEVVL